MYHILLICSLTLVAGQQYGSSIQPRMSFASNVLHSYPGPTDYKAESSVQVNFQHQPHAYSHRGARLTQTSNAPYKKNSNLFNVGYDLKFKDDFKPKFSLPIPQPLNGKKFENAEVITGKLKKNEKVRAPSVNPDLSPKEYVSHAFQKQKQAGRYTAAPTNTKVKFAVPTREQPSRYPSQSPTFTYNTKQIVKDPIQLSPDFRSSYNMAGSADKYFTKIGNGDSQAFGSFNHDVALKNSQTFDFSNAHGELNFNDNGGADSVGAGSEIEPSYNNYQNVATDLSNINIEAHIPKNLRGVKPLPLDTSLLKDPVLTTSLTDTAKHVGKMLPIHFDVRPIQSVMQREIGNSYASYKNPYGQNYQQEPSTEAQPTNQQKYYGQQESTENNNKYNTGFNYGKEYANYEEDIYKIVSLRPPPIANNFGY